jgi:hypothetical protein
MPWKGYNHLFIENPAIASAECKGHIEQPENDVALRDGKAASCGRCMMNDAGNPPDPGNKRRYTWPWFVLAAVLLAIALAMLWMSKEIARTRRIRDLNAPPPATNRGATSSGPSSPAVPGRT